MKTKTWLALVGAALMFLAAREARATGACTAARFHDWQDMGCPTLYSGAGSPGVPQSCSCQNRPTSHGMPQWWVSEPYINLCMADTPLSYTLSSGREMDFTFYYRQRTKLPDSDEVAGPNFQYIEVPYPTTNNCGTNAAWNHNWTKCVVLWDNTWEQGWRTTTGAGYSPPSYPVYSQRYQAYVCQPEGGLSYYNVASGAQSARDPASLVTLQAVTNGGYPLVYSADQYNVYNAPTADTNGIFWGDTNVGVTLAYPDGSQEVYGLSANFVRLSLAGPPSSGASTAQLLLTQRIDSQGRVTKVGYEPVFTTGNPLEGVLPSPVSFRVRCVVDPDLRTNVFQYVDGDTGSTNNWQLTEIDDPYGRKARLSYTFIYSGHLALGQIIDAAGLTNSFSYQGQTTNGWITTLTTPYGATRFNYYAVPASYVTDGYQQRAIYISEPEGAQQLYFYQHTNSFLANSETSPAVPGQSFDDGNNTGTNVTPHYALTYRNTFHWDRRQSAVLSDPVQSGMAESLSYQFSNPSYSQSLFAGALSALTTYDYNKAELKHWFLSGSEGADPVSITESLSSARDPSPDPAGQIPGLRTWYNYAGKPSPELIGSDPKITCVARWLPDGNSQYATYNYYAAGVPYTYGAGLVSDSESSYSKSDATIGALTNLFHYAPNNVDLVSISNSAGQFVNLGYNGNHQITTTTNALSQVTTLGWDALTHNLTSVQFPSGERIGLTYYAAVIPTTGTSALLQSFTNAATGRAFTVNNYSAGLPGNVTDDRGLTVNNSWDNLNRRTSTVFPDNTTISNIYKRLDLVATKDRLANWTYFAYDGLQHLTNAINANNATNRYFYCGCGSLSQIIDALGNPTYLNYDNQGNLTNVSFPDSSSLTWQYDLAGRMTNVSDGLTRYLQVAYNNQGLPTSIASANGTLQSAAYDALNRPISVTDANGVTVTNTFDAINELVKRTWPDGIGEGYGYSAAGLLAYTNRDQMPTLYARDGAGRLTAVTNANHEITKFAYDSPTT